MASSLIRLGMLGFATSLVSAAGQNEAGKAAHISPSFKSKMNEADHITKLSTVQEPRVGISGYLYTFERDTNIGTNSAG